jgi:hypothetical protein
MSMNCESLANKYAMLEQPGYDRQDDRAPEARDEKKGSGQALLGGKKKAGMGKDMKAVLKKHKIEEKDMAYDDEAVLPTKLEPGTIVVV